MLAVSLEEAIQKGESETTEFKKSTAHLTKIGETICGFLNRKGGRVFIGVSDDRKIVGQIVGDGTLLEIAEMIKRFEPSPQIEVDRIEIDGKKEIIVLTASPKKSDMPYVYCGRPYQRVGATTSQMSQRSYQKLLLERNGYVDGWEAESVEGVHLEDLDRGEILRTVRLGVEVGRIPEHPGEEIGSILDHLGLRKNEQLLNAAVVLFGKKFLPHFVQCQLILARFKGVDKSEFIDQKQLFGNAFVLLEEAMIFLRRHLPVAGRVLPGVLERQDEPLFPVIALREALVNAFCHRQYSFSGSAISIAIFDDRLEIWNDGSLLFGLTPADLKKDHVSHQRNPLIANVFYCRGLIERWGRGTQKIVSLCVKAGHPEPQFYEQANSFVIRFLPRGYIAPHRISHNLSDRQRHILQALSNVFGGAASFSELKNGLAAPPPSRTLHDDFQHLKRLGLIDVTGHGRGAKWYLVSSNKAE